MEKKSLERDYRTVNIADLQPYPNNPRINENAVDSVAKSIEQCGYIAPIIVDENNVILAGHTRLKALQKLGRETAQVVIVKGMTEEEKRKYRLLDNKTDELSSWDFDRLGNELEGLDFGDLDLNWGIDTDPDPLETKEDNFNEDMQEEESQSKLGDIYQLGRHRLMCGDSTKDDDVKKLIDGQNMAILFTSPPYSDLREYKDGMDVSADHISQFIKAYEPYVDTLVINLGIITREREIVPYWDKYIDVAKECEYKLMAWNVWDKEFAGSVGAYEQYFPLQHEWIFVFGKVYRELNRTVRKKEENIGENKKKKTNRQTDGTTKETTKGDTSHRLKKMGSVTRCHAENNSSSETHKHPARFPVELPRQYINAMTDEGENVIDCFGGSGTTLIACEQLNRNCYMMEMDPKWVDLTIRRWEKFTGQKAVKISGE